MPEWIHTSTYSFFYSTCFECMSTVGQTLSNEILRLQRLEANGANSLMGRQLSQHVVEVQPGKYSIMRNWSFLGDMEQRKAFE